MARRQLGNRGSGEIYKFVEVGQRVVGKLLAVRDGDFGGLADLETDGHSVITIGLSYQLECIRTDAKVGEFVEVTYLGDAQTNMGRTVKRYAVVASDNKDDFTVGA